MIKTAVAAAVLAVATASGANAATVLFSQDFNSLPQVLGTTTVPGFTVTGTVDIVTNGNFGISCVGNTGACLDIDGTPGPGRIQSNEISFVAGRAITISFDLGGNQRDNVTDDFEFGTSFDQTLALSNFSACFYTFGCSAPVNIPFASGIFAGFSVEGTDPWRSVFLTFTPATSGSLLLDFYSNSADNVGPLLDNVLVSQAVPEPASWAMLIAGFGLVGAAARRRRITVAA